MVSYTEKDFLPKYSAWGFVNIDLDLEYSVYYISLSANTERYDYTK